MLRVIGFLGLGLVPMNALLMALWGTELGATPAMVGLMIGIRSLLPLFLSLHAGAMIDRLGARRVMAVSAAVGALTVPLYVLLPTVPVALALQLVGGLAQAVLWIAAQSSAAGIAQAGRSDAAVFSFLSVAGTAAAPLLTGYVWTAAGAEASFALVFAWNAAMVLAVIACPRKANARPLVFRASDILPRRADYAKAWALLQTPTVAFIVAMTFFRLAIMGIQSSFYVVFLQADGLDTARIGFLISLTSIMTAVASLLVRPLTALISENALLIVTTALAIVSISLTPLLPSYASLIAAAIVIGATSGIGMPLIITVLAAGAEASSKGLSFGLRGTANRLASLLIPWGMGAVAEFFGLRASFFIVGGALMAALATCSLLYARAAGMSPRRT